MKKRFSLIGGYAGLLLAAGIALPGSAALAGNPVFESQIQAAKIQKPQNRERIESLAKAAKLNGQLFYFAVPAMSDVMRLGYTYPEDGEFNGVLRVVAAQDEFEPASFQLFSLKDQNVTLSCSDLKSKDGKVLPASAVDLKVVKIWLQNGNAWISYFADPGLKQVPELLLYDENIIEVDTNGKEPANYALLKNNGKTQKVWISAPGEVDKGTFNAIRENFQDADKLQPVSLKADEFKQFFATIHVPANQAAGVYSGVISVKSGNQNVLEIPLKVRVLPYQLPAPATSYDINKPFITSVMGGFTMSGLVGQFADEKLGKAAYKQYLINQKNHGILHPCVDQDEENIALLKELGFPTKPIMMGKNFLPWYARNFGGRLTYDNIKTAEAAADEAAAFYNKLVGHTDVLTSYGDEQGAAFVTTHRPVFKFFHKYDFKLGCAGHDALLNKGGYIYGQHPMGGAPDAVNRIQPWNAIDKGNYVGFYATQHTGSENPQFIRRQNGMLGYLSNLSMIFNYEFATGPWNDRDSILYRPMVVAYVNRGGIVDTLQWEGFREGVDDMRYATMLRKVAAEEIASGNYERKLEALKALQYLALLNAEDMDLNAFRMEAIRHIDNMLAMRAADKNPKK